MRRPHARLAGLLTIALTAAGAVALGVALRSVDDGATLLRGRLVDAAGAPWRDRPLRIVERSLLDGSVDPTAAGIAAYEAGRGRASAMIRTDENGDFEAGGLLRDGEFHVFTKSHSVSRNR